MGQVEQFVNTKSILNKKYSHSNVKLNEHVEQHIMHRKEMNEDKVNKIIQMQHSQRRGQRERGTETT